jgi:hypothetical protein
MSETTRPVSLGHEKLLALGMGGAELGRSVGGTKQAGDKWLRGTKPERFLDAFHRVHGIPPADWERRPTSPESGGGGDEPPEPPSSPRDDADAVDLEATLRHVRAARAKAEVDASHTSVASLLAQESRLVQAITAERLRQQTERDRVCSCKLVQGAVRTCTDILREALGDDWSEVSDRIMRAWAALDDEGKLPEGFEP